VRAFSVIELRCNSACVRGVRRCNPAGASAYFHHSRCNCIALLFQSPNFVFFTLLFLIPSSETDVQCGAGHVDIKVELQEAGYGAAAHKAWFEDVMAAKSIENSRSLLEQQAKTF
jgi:hypothetical protein